MDSTRKLLFLIAGVVIIVLAFLFLQSYFRDNPLFMKQATVVVNGQTFKADVAQTEKEKQAGLSKRGKMADNKAMLFTFDKADYYQFWMKDMRFPIDIIYINNDKVVTVFKNVPNPDKNNTNLPVYRSEEPANRVLEINAGLSDKYNIKPGDTVKITL